jgi:AcrR family transcriptional regulator
MPRHADPDLEERVLDAAQTLWRRGGDKKLSMRTLARAARTNTPAIYRRFKTREDILRALLLRLRQEIYEAVAPSQSLEEICERYIDFALRRPREYELFFEHLYEFLRAPGAPGRHEMPLFQWVLNRFAQRLGNSPAERAQLVLAIWALAHGTATLLILKAAPPGLVQEMRTACTNAVAELVRHAEKKQTSA